MPKKYKIRKTKKGTYHVSCKHSNDSGWATTKAKAKAMGNNCPNKEYTITEELPEMTYSQSGFYDNVKVLAEDGSFITYTAADIPEEYVWDYLGAEDPGGTINPDTRVIVLLKLYGIYEGGSTPQEIMQTYNMSQQVYDALASDCDDAILTVEDDGSFSWEYLSC